MFPNRLLEIISFLSRTISEKSNATNEEKDFLAIIRSACEISKLETTT